ncbi:hypothetical protein FA95DRAFT_110000 [Auriscalpium vulgare]|uniref:Uncharacterized protein n=1 Tax=Auriscalpium vulgare TaxID=40419 RepID=A0ACB8S7A0_9AGAM|nr:hypothetical protein FA95DRAFT_110000 [Auriscalpium vulgare]
MGCTTPSRRHIKPMHGRTPHHLHTGSEAWNSNVRARMGHGIARRRARAQLAKAGESLDVSQEDMSATLAAFSTDPLWCLEKSGLPPDSKSARAVWRHIKGASA